MPNFRLELETIIYYYTLRMNWVIYKMTAI